MLEKTLEKRPKMLDEISDRLKNIEEKFEFFPLGHDNTYAKLGHLYKETISTLGPKIIVSGEQPYLSNENNASKVRASITCRNTFSRFMATNAAAHAGSSFLGRRLIRRSAKKLLGQGTSDKNYS